MLVNPGTLEVINVVSVFAFLIRLLCFVFSQILFFKTKQKKYSLLMKTNGKTKTNKRKKIYI